MEYNIHTVAKRIMVNLFPLNPEAQKCTKCFWSWSELLKHLRISQFPQLLKKKKNVVFCVILS